jgi:hypothetical protein
MTTSPNPKHPLLIWAAREIKLFQAKRRPKGKPAREPEITQKTIDGRAADWMWQSDSTAAKLARIYDWRKEA